MKPGPTPGPKTTLFSIRLFSHDLEHLKGKVYALGNGSYGNGFKLIVLYVWENSADFCSWRDKKEGK